MHRSNYLTVTSNDHGLDILHIDNPYASASIALYGGHVLTFTPKHDGRPRLWMSEQAILDGSKPIRGGIPICWPWFGPHPSETGAPQHGYLRTQQWQLIQSSDTQSGTELLLEPSYTQASWFTSPCSVKLKVLVGRYLEVSLITRNGSPDPVQIGAALHSYLQVDDIHQVQIDGLTGAFIDKTADANIAQTPESYRIDAETDRVHLCRVNDVSVRTDQLTQRLTQQGHDSVVIWNPWREKSQSMQDMADDGYLTMLCVEAAVTQGLTLEPGEQHSLTQSIY